jgi:hypothetical protein
LAGIYPIAEKQKMNYLKLKQLDKNQFDNLFFVSILKKLWFFFFAFPTFDQINNLVKSSNENHKLKR